MQFRVCFGNPAPVQHNYTHIHATIDIWRRCAVAGAKVGHRAENHADMRGDDGERTDNRGVLGRREGI